MATSVWIKTFVLIISSVGVSANTDQIKEICNSEIWCGSCLQARPECAWCNDEDYFESRCSIREDMPLCKEVIFNETRGVSKENRSLEDGSGEMDPVQLQPQHMKISLRPGQPYSFNMNYAVAKNLPIDMFFVLDFTKTMKNRLADLARLTEELILGLEAFTSNIEIGYGSFVDKVLQPFTLTTPKNLENPCWSANDDYGCDSPYGYIHRKSLNKNIKYFSESMAHANTSSNFDQMEGGLDAVLQAAVCPHITGWRNQSRRIMVYISDGGYHFAGDGRLAGVDKPNDGKCHLEAHGPRGEYIYAASNTQDYPSLAQLVKEINDNNINAYFLVSEDYSKMYEDLSDMSEQLSATTFEDTGEALEIVNKIVDAYKELVKKVTISADKIPPELEVKVASNCGSGVINTKILNVDAFKCHDLEVGQLVTFNVTITAKSCPTDYKKPAKFVIAPQGLQEKLEIEIEYICDCECVTSEELDDQKCTFGNGTYECGVCRCNPQRSGETCQCDNRDQDQVSYEQMNKIQQDKCKVNNDSEILCSNKGLCNCGQCSCFTSYFGKHCECDKKTCQRPGDDSLCSGTGACTCNGCDCTDGYHGNYCECPPADCLGKNGICNGRGKCECGRCKCEDFFNGTYCEECKPQYLSKCTKCVPCGKNDCVKCLEENSQNKDAASNECRLDCAAINITKVDKFGKDEQPCPVYDKGGCEISYLVKCDDSASYLMIAKTKYCPNPPDALWIALPLLFGIMGVGILMIIIWKILTSFYDKIEYAKFEHEIQNPKWSQTDNPIYKTATTTNQNPMYQGEAD